MLYVWFGSMNHELVSLYRELLQVSCEDEVQLLLGQPGREPCLISGGGGGMNLFRCVLGSKT